MAKKYLKLGHTLKKLLFERNIKPVELSREVQLPPATIHRLITGKSTRPYESSLKPIADFFSVSVDQLLGESPLTSELTTHNNRMRFLPLISWKNIFHFFYEQKAHIEDEQIPFLGKAGKNAFATVLSDSSMEPQFPKNTILIFDSEQEGADRSYVLAKLEDNIFVFRQLLIDGDHQFLKPLNPDLNVFKMRILGKKDEIVAVLVEARHVYVDV